MGSYRKMQQHNNLSRRLNPRSLAGAFAFLVGIGYSFAANAIIGGQVDPNTATSPWAGVGSLSVNGSSYTATAIGSRFIITAAHVVYGASAQNVNFNLNVGGDLTQSISVSSIHVYPAYHGFVPSATDGLVHDDLAVIELSSDLPTGVPIYSMLAEAPVTPQSITMVGYGTGGNGVNGATLAGSASVKRVGNNQVDMLFTGGGSNANMYLFDFDGATASTNVVGGGALNNEAQFGIGDSGSPTFVQVNGVWQLLGVNTFVATLAAGNDPFKFGALGGGILTSAYSGWIQGIVAAPVPEPAAGEMLLCGGVLLLWAMRRRRGATPKLEAVCQGNAR